MHEKTEGLGSVPSSTSCCPTGTDLSCPLVAISAEKDENQVALMLNSTLTLGAQDRAVCAMEKQSFSVSRAANLACGRKRELQRDPALLLQVAMLSNLFH